MSDERASREWALARVVTARRARLSLRTRVVLAILLAAVAPLLIVFSWSLLDRQVPGRMWGETRDAAERLASAIAGGADDASIAELAARERVRLRVLDADGAVRFDVDADDPNDRFGRIEERLLGASATALREVDATLGPPGERAVVRGARVKSPAIACDTLPLLYCEAAAFVPRAGEVVHVQRSSRRAVQAVYALRAQLLRLALLTVPISLIIAIYTGRRIVQPVEHLRKQALARASAARPAAALQARGGDEVGALAEAFNALLDALESKRRENEAFVADLVHELKNPVAAVRAASESLEAGAIDAERAARLARVLGDSSSKLNRLVTQFLELARADAGMPNEAREPVALGPLVEGLVRRMQDDPRFSDVRFVVRIDANVTVHGVPHRLDALVRELLENGASFAGAGGTVEGAVGVDESRHAALVAVRDSGPGIAAVDLPRVFDRFFTTRGARHGSGLGLALVRAVARAHGGDVDVKSDGGATFTVRLPLAS